MIRHMELSEVDWLGIKDKIPYTETEYDEQRRKELWPAFDPNGNGLVSLAEADLAFKRMGGPVMVIYYSKKVQIMAFNFAKDLNTGTDENQDDYIEFSEFKVFLQKIIEFFSYYYLFKKLDSDNDERLKVDDFVAGVAQLRTWGANFPDVKATRKAFYEFDENRGGVLLFDEFIQFAEKNQLSVEKDPDIIKNSKAPRKVYQQHHFLRAGAKRPNKIDADLWHSKSPNKDLDQEIDEIIKKNRAFLKSGQKRPANINRSLIAARKASEEEDKTNFIKQQKINRRNKQRTSSNHEFKKINYLVHTNRPQKKSETLEYEQIEQKIMSLDEENYLLKEELNELKAELYKLKKSANSYQIKI